MSLRQRNRIIFLFLCTIFTMSCKYSERTSENSERQFELVLVATSSTTVSENHRNSNLIQEGRRCGIEAGESLILKDDPKLIKGTIGNFLKITLTPNQRLKSHCSLESGFILAEHFRQEYIESSEISSKHDELTKIALGTMESKSLVQENFILSWPIQAGVISSSFGLKNGTLHEGVDLSLYPDTPIYSPADGKITYPSWNQAQSKMSFRINHFNRSETRYWLSSSLRELATGKVVLKGDEIARTRSSRPSTRSQLHFELRINGQPVDPLLHLPERVK